MFDYLGTLTKTQLLERQGCLRRAMQAVPAKVQHLRAQAQRIMGDNVVTTTTRSRSITYTAGNQTYTLGTELQPSLVNSMPLEILYQNAQLSRYGGRVDPLTGNMSLGDYSFRPNPRILTVDDITGERNVESITLDDIVGAARSERTLAPARELFKRQEGDEERVKKLQFRAMSLLDRADELESAFATYEEELAAVEALLNDSVTITLPDGTVTNTSDYLSIGVDQKVTDVTSDEDREDIFSIIFSPSTNIEAGDPPCSEVAWVNAVIPSEQVRVNIPDDATPGDIEEFLAEFPVVPRSLGRSKLQLMANVFEYGFKSGVLQQFSNSTSLIRNETGGGGTRDESNLSWVPLNVKQDLEAFAASVYATWGVRLRITEAWPATGNHSSLAHFTGNCIDLVLDVASLDATISGYTVPDLAGVVIRHGKQNGWIRSGLNEYKHETSYKTGAHIHLNMNIQYLNEAKLFTLGRG